MPKRDDACKRGEKRKEKVATYQTRDTFSASYRKLASGQQMQWTKSRLLMNECYYLLQLLWHWGHARAQSAVRKVDASGRLRLMMMASEMLKRVMMVMMMVESCLDR